MARRRASPAQSALPEPAQWQSAAQILHSGGPFVPFPTCSILDWRESSGPGPSATQVPFSKWLAARLREGRPLVVKDFHRLAEWDPRIFNLDSLIQLSTDKSINIRSCENGRGQMCTLKSYVEAMKSSSGGLPNLYARDLPCPKEWMELCNKVVPQELQWGGAMDLFQWLPQYARSEVMMAYVGSRGSYSGFHRCFGAAVALNLLIEAQEHVLCFGTDHASQTKYDMFMDSRGISSHTDWANMTPDQLRGADFPIYVQEQKVGDLVIFPPATAHQVWNRAPISAKLVWNILHPLSVEVGMDYIQPSYNRLCHADLARTSLSLACAVLSLTSRDSLRTLPPELALLTRLFERLVESETIDGRSTTPIKLTCLPYASVAECNYCGQAIWNRHVQCTRCKDFDVCLTCFAGGRSCEHVSSYVWAEIVPVETLDLALARAKEALGPATEATQRCLEKGPSLGTCVNEQLSLRNNGKTRLCHLCRAEHPEWKGRQCQTCSTFFCFRGLYRHFELFPLEVIKHAGPWTCPKCREICNCRCCHFPNAHVARPKPPKKQRVTPIDSRGKTLGFMDNVFDKRRQSENLGVLSKGNRRASSTLILPNSGTKGQKRSLSCFRDGIDRNASGEGQIQSKRSEPSSFELDHLEASRFGTSEPQGYATESPGAPHAETVHALATLAKRTLSDASITEGDGGMTRIKSLIPNPGSEYSYHKSNAVSSAPADSQNMSLDHPKADAQASPAIGQSVSQLEREIQQLHKYADELLELSLHESHGTLMQRVSTLETQLKLKRAEKSSELIGKLQTEFPALAAITKQEMERLGYLK